MRAHTRTRTTQVICVAATKADNPTRKVTEKEGRDWAAAQVCVCVCVLGICTIHSTRKVGEEEGRDWEGEMKGFWTTPP